MRRLGLTLAHAIAVAGVICGLATPAFADHDDHRHHRRWHRDHHEYYRDWPRPRAYYYRGYGEYYYRPHVEYYAPPVYVPPPPVPSFGLNLVFPIH